MTSQLNVAKDQLEGYLREIANAYYPMEVKPSEILKTELATVSTGFTNITRQDFEKILFTREIEISDLTLRFNHEYPAHPLMEADEIDEDADQDTIDRYWAMAQEHVEDMTEEILRDELGLECESVSEAEIHNFGDYTVRAILKRPIVVGFSKVEGGDVEVSVR